VNDRRWFCNNCSHDWQPGVQRPIRYDSLESLIARTGLRRDEVVTLADIGALNSFGYDRRSALWQVERAIKASGALFNPVGEREQQQGGPSPLRPMTLPERLHADYEGTGLTLGRHPMALRREALNQRGVLRACDLRQVAHSRWVRTAGAVITRQRPGTAKGFVFLTLEDETGLINVIIRPQLFTSAWKTIIEEPFLYIEGPLQNVDNVINIRAERVTPLAGMPPLEVTSHDFY
jgi:error-prone DNA polymerase